MRKYISALLGIILIVGGGFAFVKLKNSKKNRRPKGKKVVPTVFVDKVKNIDVPVTVVESGRLMSKNRIELFSQVQGIMIPGKKDFKPGVSYSKGSILVRIQSDDYYANLQAQKSNLQNLISAMLPDLKIDYPSAFEKWNAYLNNFEMDKPVGTLPETSSGKEKIFITSKNIYTNYYNTKNLEITLRKYTIRAPFTGVLTESLITPGTLVRQGQKLGEFIDTSVYEMEVAVSKNLLSSLSKGKKVLVKDTENNKEWEGKVVRINGKVNPETQTVQVYIELRGKDLREGLYLEAIINAKEEKNAIEISRSLLVDESKVYTVKDGKLELVKIDPVHFTEKTAIIRGLNNGDQLISKAIPGAFEGMSVKIYQPK